MTYCELPHEVMDELQIDGIVATDTIVTGPDGRRAIKPETRIALSCRARAHGYIRDGRAGRAAAFATAAELVEAALGIAPRVDRS